MTLFSCPDHSYDTDGVWHCLSPWWKCNCSLHRGSCKPHLEMPLLRTYSFRWQVCLRLRSGTWATSTSYLRNTCDKVLLVLNTQGTAACFFCLTLAGWEGAVKRFSAALIKARRWPLVEKSCRTVFKSAVRSPDYWVLCAQPNREATNDLLLTFRWTGL